MSEAAMSESTPRDDRTADAGRRDPLGEAPESRREYAPPRIEYLGRLETMAADCGTPPGKSNALCTVAFS